MTTKKITTLHRAITSNIEDAVPAFMLSFIRAAHEDIHEDILFDIEQDAVEGFNPVNYDEDHDAWFDHNQAMIEELWSIIFKKLGITDELVKSFDKESEQ